MLQETLIFEKDWNDYGKQNKSNNYNKTLILSNKILRRITDPSELRKWRQEKRIE